MSILLLQFERAREFLHGIWRGFRVDEAGDLHEVSPVGESNLLHQLPVVPRRIIGMPQGFAWRGGDEAVSCQILENGAGAGTTDIHAGGDLLFRPDGRRTLPKEQQRFQVGNAVDPADDELQNILRYFRSLQQDTSLVV